MEEFNFIDDEASLSQYLPHPTPKSRDENLKERNILQGTGNDSFQFRSSLLDDAVTGTITDPSSIREINAQSARGTLLQESLPNASLQAQEDVNLDRQPEGQSAPVDATDSNNWVGVGQGINAPTSQEANNVSREGKASSGLKEDSCELHSVEPLPVTRGGKGRSEGKPSQVVPDSEGTTKKLNTRKRNAEVSDSPEAKRLREYRQRKTGEIEKIKVELKYANEKNATQEIKIKELAHKLEESEAFRDVESIINQDYSERLKLMNILNAENLQLKKKIEEMEKAMTAILAVQQSRVP